MCLGSYRGAVQLKPDADAVGFRGDQLNSYRQLPSSSGVILTASLHAGLRMSKSSKQLQIINHLENCLNVQRAKRNRAFNAFISAAGHQFNLETEVHEAWKRSRIGSPSAAVCSCWVTDLARG